jgi:hypothetical protein
MIDNLRRVDRVRVCCRALARDRYGVWTGVTEDLSERGCRIITSRTLRPGTQLVLTLASDLFLRDLEVLAEVVWSGPTQLGARFLAPAAGAHLTPDAWVRMVVEHGAVAGWPRVLPAVSCVLRGDELGEPPGAAEGDPAPLLEAATP